MLLSMFLLFGVVTFAQSKTITGKVTDNSGAPIPGVSVSIGTRGTTTDAGGNYSISAPGNAKRISFSSTEFTPQTVSLAGRSSYDVSLTPSNTKLSEVVVVAYGTQRRAAVTGACDTSEAYTWF